MNATADDDIIRVRFDTRLNNWPWVSDCGFKYAFKASRNCEVRGIYTEVIDLLARAANVSHRLRAESGSSRSYKDLAIELGTDYDVAATAFTYKTIQDVGRSDRKLLSGRLETGLNETSIVYQLPLAVVISAQPLDAISLWRNAFNNLTVFHPSLWAALLLFYLLWRLFALITSDQQWDRWNAGIRKLFYTPKLRDHFSQRTTFALSIVFVLIGGLYGNVLLASLIQRRARYLIADEYDLVRPPKPIRIVTYLSRVSFLGQLVNVADLTLAVQLAELDMQYSTAWTEPGLREAVAQADAVFITDRLTAHAKVHSTPCAYKSVPLDGLGQVSWAMVFNARHSSRQHWLLHIFDRAIAATYPVPDIVMDRYNEIIRHMNPYSCAGSAGYRPPPLTLLSYLGTFLICGAFAGLAMALFMGEIMINTFRIYYGENIFGERAIAIRKLFVGNE